LALATALHSNTTLTSLNLGYNHIGDEGVPALATALMINKTLTSLNLKGNQIGPAGAQALAAALMNNKTLTSFDLRSNQIRDEGAQALATAIQNNTALKNLNLEGNQIGPEGAEALATALQTNPTLTSLYLGYNHIGDEGVAALAIALENNIALTSLNLWNNQVGASGLQALACALENNPTLTSINLEHNLELERYTELDTINEITERNKNIIPQINSVITRIIFESSKEKFSIPQIRFISNKYRPENCVKILENLARSVSNKSIPTVLQSVRDIKGAMGAMILYASIKAQESDLPQNKLSLPKDKLELVKNKLTEMNLANWFQAKRVTKEGVTHGFCDNSRNVKLNATTENHILKFLEIGDIKTTTPSATVDISKKEVVNLVSGTATNTNCKEEIFRFL
jgi:hypothetical protein